ncbi:MAG: DUF2281 domain-containing protein [Armatimonadetes bacterium]|nr:DUF2281 domain-containing protein [Armatimonadota bacterium]
MRLLPSEQQGLEQEPTIKGKPSIRSLPFFGMWADREDMTDSAAWVRKERERWDERLAG